MIAGFGLFFMMYFGKAIEAIAISRSTIQEIAYDGNIFRVKTFGGKTFEIDKFSEVLESETFFAKKHIKFLFKNNANNMIVRYNSNEFYISGCIAGIESLRELLYAGNQRT